MSATEYNQDKTSIQIHQKELSIKMEFSFEVSHIKYMINSDGVMDVINKTVFLLQYYLYVYVLHVFMY